MEINIEMVEKLANLSRLQFNAEEMASIHHDLQQMIQFVDKLNEIDTSGIEPLTHISIHENSLREDEVRGSVDAATALSNAPLAINSFFAVQKVIKK